MSLESGDEPAVLGVSVRLGNCINLLDTAHHAGLAYTYQGLVQKYGDKLPKNTTRGAHFLDRLVVDTFCEKAEQRNVHVQTVRGSFAEGEPIYPGSKILSKAHTQIAVRDTVCIQRIQLITFP